MKVVVAEKISATGLNVLASQAGWTIATPAEFAADRAGTLRDADALIVRSAVYVDAAVLAEAPRLRIIGRAGVGVDNIDLEAATRAGVLVMNTPGANAIAVAEHAIGLMLALARQIPRADAATHQGRWEKKSLQGTQLHGKTLGVVGLGRIGQEVAARAQAMGMTVLAHDPYLPASLARDLQISLVSLETLYADSDYITLHVSLTPQTAGMINATTLASMKPGIRIVNCARGELVDEGALAAALKSGRVGGAALDVFATEPPKNSPLLECDNVVLTPHIAGSTAEALEVVGFQIASQIVEYLSRGIAQNSVNMPSLSDVEFREMKPYIELATKTGSLLAQIFDGNLEEIRVGYAGVLTEWKTDLLRNAAVAGVLAHGAGDNVNLVNALAQAAARHLRVAEERVPPDATKSNTLTIMLRGRSAEVMARGTVVRRGDPARIIELNGIEIESPLSGNLLVIKNRDVPGVIGEIGRVLGAHGINIARFALGRENHVANAAEIGASAPTQAPPNAMSIVQTDQLVDAAAAEELRRFPAIQDVRVIRL